VVLGLLQGVPADSIRRAVREVFLRPEYRWVAGDQPLHWFRDLWRRFVEWLARLTTAHPALSQVVFWGLLFLLVALLAPSPSPGAGDGQRRGGQPLPARAEVARSFSCPAGTERMGGAPPEAFETWCERMDEPPGRRREGPALRWYDDGGLAEARAFTRGELDGAFLEWHRNGRPARAGAYRRNERVGTWTVWFEDGRQEEECRYEQGKRNGAFATWWRNGARRVEGRYCQDLQCGTWTSWDELGHELGKVTYEEIRKVP